MRILWLLLLASFVGFTSGAQETKSLKKVLEIKLPSGDGSNSSSVVYFAATKRYYSSMIGNASYMIHAFDANGKLLSGGSVKAGIDIRGLWYNPRKARLQGNGYKDGGWFDYKLDGKGIPADYTVTLSGTHQPTDQTAGVYNYEDNEVWFFDGTDVYFYDAQTGEVKSSISLASIIETSDMDELYEEDCYATNTLIYTGKPGKELGLLNYEDGTIDIFSKAGKLKTILEIPSSQSLPKMFCFAYSNNLYWIFDKDARTWTGYAEGSAVTKKSSPSVSSSTGGGVVSSSTYTTSRGTYGRYTKIVKPGDLYSSTKIYDDYYSVYSDFRSRLGSTAADEIVKRSHENGWPGNYATLDKRNIYREKYTQFNTYYVADLGSDRALLWIPKAENGHLEYAMQLPYDIYMVYSKSALTLGDKVTPKVATSGTGSSGVVSSSSKSTRSYAGTGTYGRYSYITDPGKLYTTMTLSNGSVGTRIKDKFSYSVAENIFNNSHERSYPSGINTLSGWGSHKSQYQDYNLYYVDDIESDKVLLWVRPAENRHMPSDMIGSNDFYFVIGKNAVVLGDKVSPVISGSSNSNPNKNSNSNERAISSFRQTYINDAGQFYSTYDPKTSDPSFVTKLKQDYGDNIAEKILNMAHENGWPNGINTFTKRDTYRNRFKEYKAYYVADVGTDKVLLWIPNSENQHMPAAMVGTGDMYVIYSKSAVTLGDKVHPNYK